MRAAVEELAGAGGFSLDALNNRLKGAASDTVNTMFRAKIAELEKAGRIGNMLIYDNVLKGLERFAGMRIRFDVITVAWLGKYADFMRKEGKRQTTNSNSPANVARSPQRCKALGRAQRIAIPVWPGTIRNTSRYGRKMALTLEQIGQIANYDDGSEATAKYRDYWLFLYLCNGINVADFVKLRYRDIVNGEICFVRQKTESTSRTLRDIQAVLTPPMQTIIDRWGQTPYPDAFIFPILTGKEDAITRKNKTKYLTRAINKRMKEVGEKLGIGNISTYTARHSFATVLKRAGANIAYISESLGHQDLKTTENYLASFEREEREKMRNY